MGVPAPGGARHSSPPPDLPLGPHPPPSTHKFSNATKDLGLQGLGALFLLLVLPLFCFVGVFSPTILWASALEGTELWEEAGKRVT